MLKNVPIIFLFSTSSNFVTLVGGLNISIQAGIEMTKIKKWRF